MELRLNILNDWFYRFLCDCKLPMKARIMWLHGWLGLKVPSRDSWLMFWRVVRQIWRTPGMIQISVALPNGHAELLTLPPSSTVQDVRTKAQRAFGKKCLRLITAKNRVLVDFEQTLEEAEIEDSEWLTALVLQPQPAATESAFALWCHGDRTIVAWGDADFGGDSSAVQAQPWSVQQTQATGSAFAAILEDGSVCTWEITQWRWQFGSSRSALECAADSGHKRGLCRDSGRWSRGYLEPWKLWRWLFGSSRSGEPCLVQLCIPKWQSLRSYTYNWKGSQRSKSSTIRFIGICVAASPVSRIVGAFARLWPLQGRAVEKDGAATNATCANCFFFFSNHVPHRSHHIPFCKSKVNQMKLGLTFPHVPPGHPLRELLGTNLYRCQNWKLLQVK